MNKFKDVESFDDIIFEKRNKNYGAYYLRKKYSKNLLIGLLISILLAFILVGVQKYTEFHQQEEDMDYYAAMYNESNTEFINETPPPLYSPPIKPLELEENKPEENNLVPEIVDSLKEELKPENENEIKDPLVNNADTSSTANDGQLDGTDNGSEKIYFMAMVEKMPIFPGGDFGLRRYIASNVVYPRIAREKGIEGVVYIQFCVNSTGVVEKVSVVKSVDPMLDKEAFRVISSLPKWTPAEQHGKKVSVWYTVPLNFDLGN